MDWFKEWSKPKRIFLDYASATPVLPEVRMAMDKYWTDEFHNTSAIYQEGLVVKSHVENCRAQIARSLGVASSGIIFTSGGTESDNLAIIGSFEESLKTFKKPHIIISAIEHPAVMEAAQEVMRRGGEMSVVPVDEEGLVSINALKKLVKKTTFMVSIGLANNEIGTVQPLSKIGRTLGVFRKKNKSLYPLLHSDASQAANYIDVRPEALHADLVTLDGSKIYGPKGVGILILKRGVKIHSTSFGGKQEGGRRAGTLSPALIAGFCKAFEIVLKDREKEATRIEHFRHYAISTIIKHAPLAVINGSPEYHLPNIVSVSLPNTLSEFILLKLDREGVMASVGSACSNDEKESGSPVIVAIGKPEMKESTIRFSFGRQSTVKETKKAMEIFCRIASNVLK